MRSDQKQLVGTTQHLKDVKPEALAGAEREGMVVSVVGVGFAEVPPCTEGATLS